MKKYGQEFQPSHDPENNPVCEEYFNIDKKLAEGVERDERIRLVNRKVHLLRNATDDDLIAMAKKDAENSPGKNLSISLLKFWSARTGTTAPGTNEDWGGETNRTELPRMSFFNVLAELEKIEPKLIADHLVAELTSTKANKEKLIRHLYQLYDEAPSEHEKVHLNNIIKLVEKS